MVRAVGTEVGDCRLLGERANDSILTNSGLEIELKAEVEKC